MFSDTTVRNQRGTYHKLRGWYVKRQSTAQLPHLLTHLSSLLQAGLSLHQAFHYLHRQLPNRTWAVYVGTGLDAVEAGHTLSSAWKNHAPNLFTMLLEAGERTGKLSEVFEIWVSHVTERGLWWAEMKRIATYPTVLIFGVCMFLWFVTRMVFPQFDAMYGALGAGVPRGLQRAEWYVAHLPWLCFGLLICLGVLVLISATLVRKVARLQAFAKKCMPFGRFRQLLRTYILCGVIRLLLQSGIPIAEAMSVLGADNSTPWLRVAAEGISDAIYRGVSVVEAFSGDWDPMLNVLLQWAHETGQLPDAFSRVETYVFSLMRRRLKLYLQIAEPAIFILMGAIVTGTLLVVFLPMYTLVSTISSGAGL